MGPADLSELLAPLLSATPAPDAVLVGPGTSDDAGVYRLGDTGLVATADFITPVCDDALRFGRVAAANALSDVYAMGGQPLFALNLCCFPSDRAPLSLLQGILAGGMEQLAAAGAALLGGHSVRDPELKYGLAVVGRVDPELILTNAGAHPGDRLVLTKPLGTGAIINGFRKDALDEAGLEPALATMECLNDVAARLALEHRATACTDVSGYGLAGHALEVARASGVGLRIRVDALPAHEAFERMCALGISTRGTRDNEAAAQGAVEDRAGTSARDRQLLFDPQTSGGLLLTVPAPVVGRLLADLESTGHRAAHLGEVIDGPARIEIV